MYQELTIWYDGYHATCKNEECDKMKSINGLTPGMSTCPFAFPPCERVQDFVDQLGEFEQILRDNGIDLDDLKRGAEMVSLERRQLSDNKELTLGELQKMDGEVVWCKEEKHWGLVSVEDCGRWNGIPFFLFTQNGCHFNLNIADRKLTVFHRQPEKESK